MYRIELSCGGVVVKTITPLTKKEAKRCYYTHFERGDYGVRLYVDDLPLSHNKAAKHFGKWDRVWYEDGHERENHIQKQSIYRSTGIYGF